MGQAQSSSDHVQQQQQAVAVRSNDDEPMQQQQRRRSYHGDEIATTSSSRRGMFRVTSVRHPAAAAAAAAASASADFDEELDGSHQEGTRSRRHPSLRRFLRHRRNSGGSEFQDGDEAPLTPRPDRSTMENNNISVSSISIPFEDIMDSPPRAGGQATVTVTFETGPPSRQMYFDNDDISCLGEDNVEHDFYPNLDPLWMGRSIESLLLGHLSRARILADHEDGDGDYDFYALRRRSTASTFGGGRRRSSAGSFPGGRRGSLSLSGSMQGGTLANYYSSRHQRAGANRSATTTDVVDRTSESSRRTSTGPRYRRRSSVASLTPSNSGDAAAESASSRSRKGGPNVLLNIMARESTGRTVFPRGIPESSRLRLLGGASLYAALDKPAAGIVSEVAFLAAAIHTGDWGETHAIVSRLVVRLIGDGQQQAPTDRGRSSIQDPNLPPTAHKYYAGGGRLGLERDAFVQAGGVQVLIGVFREKSFVGQEVAYTNDARDLSEGIVANRLAPCWNEALASLRELVYFIPSLVEDGAVLDNGNFLPFLFTLLSHASCFDGAAALIEEMLSFMSQTQQQPAAPQAEGDETPTTAAGAQQQQPLQPSGRTTPASAFFLGNVPDLYKLWRGFNCRQLAHFCRILALLVFEPEDRQLLESPAVLKSLELLQLRRNRAARAGRDSTVDMNQAILLGDEVLIQRLLQLLSVMNYAPPLRRYAPYHVMAHFPFIADTLVMLGLSELDSWEEIDRQDGLARKLLEGRENASPSDGPEILLSDLGAVADMLESLAETLGPGRQAPNQIGSIIHVITAAQQAGIIVGRNRNRRARRHRQRSRAEASPRSNAIPSDGEDLGAEGDDPLDGSTIQGLASVAGILTDQILVRRLYQSASQDSVGSVDRAADDGLGVGGLPVGLDRDSPRDEVRHFINTPEDSANSMQFNAMLLGPYQVEVLFVLCTLLGGRRKLDAQDTLNRLGIISVLDAMFQRLPWYKKDSSEESEDAGGDNGDADQDGGDQPNGIHGPGCECTPESALCVQYLRMLHNFCDRDCDNYQGRRLLLSEGEQQLIFDRKQNDETDKPKPGLLSKIISAFIGESDESPYRFWLASCIESYLRGSSPEEQMFVAQTGLLDHLVAEISSERLHCAGGLQTSFDLLGELGKGNVEVVRLLVNGLDEESFRKLMSVAAANLVDSNVFIRSLLLSLERLSAKDGILPLYLDVSSSTFPMHRWASPTGSVVRSYLTHSWWDATPISLTDETDTNSGEDRDEQRSADWFPPQDLVTANNVGVGNIAMIPSGLNESVGHFGWVFTPVGDALSANAYLPNTVERLSWFLAANQARLLRDLLGVVDLTNINHENICCLNTAVVIAIFAHRRKQLALLLEELRQMNDEEKDRKRRAVAAARQGDVVDRAFAQAARYLDLSQRESPPYARRASLSHAGSQQIGDRTDVMRNFREVLWFWMEYYTHRGRDRLSLEFSSHIRFQEWNHVVSLLAADDGSSTSLVRTPVRLPRSPYQRAARVADVPVRGE